MFAVKLKGGRGAHLLPVEQERRAEGLVCLLDKGLGSYQVKAVVVYGFQSSEVLLFTHCGP